MNTTECELSSAKCEKIDKYCICSCYPGFVTMNGPCLKGNICRKCEHDSYRRLSYHWFDSETADSSFTYSWYMHLVYQSLNNCFIFKSFNVMLVTLNILDYFASIPVFFFYIHLFWPEFSIKKNPDSLKKSFLVEQDLMINDF